MAVGEQAAEKIADTQCSQHRRDQRRPCVDAASEIRTKITRSQHFETHHDRAGEEGGDVNATSEKGKRPTCSALYGLGAPALIRCVDLHPRLPPLTSRPFLRLCQEGGSAVVKLYHPRQQLNIRKFRRPLD